MDTPLIIQTVSLKKFYGAGETRVIALAGIDLEIRQGELVAVMGPSGSGKSTLLNILACLDHPSEGRYFLNGTDVSSFNRTELAFIRSSKLGMVFQSYNLLPRLTALENVMLPLFYRRENHLTSAESRERALAALEKVGLSGRDHHYPNQLSGGQQQRVAIARALINDPVLILADEPTGNLDSHASAEIMELFQQLHEQGRTILVVTHEREVADQTERILTMRDGALVSDHSNGSSKKPDHPASQPAVEVPYELL